MLMNETKLIRHRDEVVKAEFVALKEASLAIAGSIAADEGKYAAKFLLDSYYDITAPTPTAAVVKEIVYDMSLLSTDTDDEIRTNLNVLTDFVMPFARTRTDLHVARAKLGTNGSVDRCSMAEPYFARTLGQVNRGAKVPGEFDEVTVFHDSTGRPLAIKKAHDAHSALTLVGMNIGGLTVPSGTICRFGSKDKSDQVLTGQQQVNTKKVYYAARTLLVDENVEVMPARFSPWAYDDPFDRAAFGLVGNYVDRERVKIATGNTIADFQAAADKILKICGVPRLPANTMAISSAS
jgi:hypothetical protein